MNTGFAMVFLKHISAKPVSEAKLGQNRRALRAEEMTVSTTKNQGLFQSQNR